MYTHSGVDSIVMNFVCYNKNETTSMGTTYRYCDEMKC